MKVFHSPLGLDSVVSCSFKLLVTLCSVYFVVVQIWRSIHCSYSSERVGLSFFRASCFSCLRRGAVLAVHPFLYRL